MSRPKISVVGQLRYSESEGIQYSFTIRPPGKEITVWLEALSNADEEWPGIEKTEDREAYAQALHSDPSYRQAAKDFLERQRLEPQLLWILDRWVYKDKVLRFDSDEFEDRETAAMLVKHYVLRRERHYDRIRREVEALENFEKLEQVSREPIPERVRLFVWQRDNGRCVKCGSHERLEFDHIIPVAAGGNNTERNVQLLCESCNRSKGSTI